MDDRFTLLGRLAAGVAHDLSNYLCVVDLTLQKLERHAREAKLTECVHAAREATGRAQQLSACLLSYARGGSPAAQTVDLAALVGRVLDLFRSLIPESVEVAVRIEPEAPLVDGIAPELEQLLLNLVQNACEAMPEGGTLEVAVRRAAAGASLQVSDTGRGLHPRVRAADGAGSPSTKAGRPGCGLGLGIVRGVVERHGATLEIAGRPGGGTSFTVSFPGAAR